MYGNYYQQRRPNPLEDMKRFFRDSSILPRLIIANVGIWILIQVAYVFGMLFKYPVEVIDMAVLEYFALPASLDILITRPWTLFTYMFLHTDFWHILFNMLWLYWFGKIFLQYLNQRQMLITYLLGGLAGGLLYILSFNVFPVFADSLIQARALGASASVMAIVVAIAMYVPNYTINLLFIGRVKIFYLAIVLFVLDFFMIRHGNSGGHIAHIGGAIYGFLYIHYLRQGRDMSKMFPGRGNRKIRFKRKNTSGGQQNYGRPVSDEEYNRKKAANQKRIDKILEKISRSGYDSLTKEEKALLFDSSHKNNK